MAAHIAAAVVLALAPVAGRVAWREWQVEDLARAMRGNDADRREALARFGDVPPAALPLRAAAALAQSALACAAATTDPALRILWHARAAALLANVEARQPGWATTRILRAQFELARHGAITAAGRAALAASYRAEPFRRQEGLWRLAYAAAAWPALAPVTRAAALAEADWLVRIDGGLAGPVAAALGDSPAGLAFALRHPSS